MNGLYKDANAIINRNSDYFNGLNDVKQIIVLGHSLNMVDLPYFLRIVEATGTDASWKFSFYGTQDINNINNFIKIAGLTNTKVIYFDEFLSK